MKTIIAFLMALCLCLCLCSCDSTTPEENNYTTTDKNIDTDYYDYSSSEVDYLSETEAELIALEKLYWWLECCFGDEYDISETRCSVGSVTGSSSVGYTVYGRYCLCDKYGDFSSIRKFSVFVDSSGRVHYDDIDLFA